MAVSRVVALASERYDNHIVTPINHYIYRYTKCTIDFELKARKEKRKRPSIIVCLNTNLISHNI